MGDSETLSEVDISKYFDRDEQRKLGSKITVISKPIEIGSFSLDCNRKFANNKSQLSYLEDGCNLGHRMDLNDGYHDRFVKRDDNVKERLNNLLRWIISNLHKFRKSGDETTDESLLKFPDFILWRGHMTKIMCTPYEKQDGWEMAAQQFGSTIYISEVETAEAEKRRMNQTEKEKVMTYWGVRFEKYMTRPNPPSGRSPKSPRLAPVDQTSAVVNTNEAFCTVMKAKLNSLNIIHSAEVDCCLHPECELEPPDNYVELKTSREFTARQQEHNFHRYKTKKWWAQSYLAGVPQITCGFRNDSGTVVRISDFKTLDLPRMARNVPGGSWDANVCLSFLENFFGIVKGAFEKCDGNPVVIFSWNPGDDKIFCKTYDSKSSHNFLPEWYTSSLKCMKYAS